MSAGPEQTQDTAAESGAENGDQQGGEETGRRPMRRSSKIALVVILVVAVVAAVAIAASYFLDARNYVTTDNAQVDGTRIPIVAPTSGRLIDWTATQGSILRTDQVVGRVQLDGGYVQPQRVIRSPAAGTVAMDSTTQGAYITAGTQLAVAYDPADVYVTARVEETDINDVRVGQPVTFTVDAFGGREFTGSVREIQGGAAGVFSPLPQSNSSGNFQKVTQVIPVKISIDDLEGSALIPGMNVEANIRVQQ